MKHATRSTQKKEKEPTLHDVLSAVNQLSLYLEKRMDRLEERVSLIEGTMVTKDYLDKRLSILRGNIMEVLYKLDKKVTLIVNELGKRNILPKQVVKQIHALPPFPKSLTKARA